MEDLLKRIGIAKTGEFDSKNNYCIDIKNSDEWGKYYSILEKKADDGVIESQYEQVNADMAVLTYKVDDYTVSLNANFEEDNYSIVIKKTEEDEDDQ